DCEIEKESNAYRAYDRKLIGERHRHRYEVNNNLRYKLVENGMKLTGINPERDLVEIVEVEDHPWFVGVQFHPELQSTVNNPHPLFVDFVEACLNYAESKDAAASEEGQAVGID